MLLPVGTDAPIYHRPIMTGVLVAANVAMFVYGDCWTNQPNRDLILQFGQGLQPYQWLTSAFMHAGLVHLLGNMLFLVAFGIVVEGKLGWWRFGLYYLGIACLEGFLVQYGCLDRESGGALGASGAIYGLLATVLIWAPENEVEYVWIHCRFWGMNDSNSTTYLNFCGYFLLSELFCLWWLRWSMSSQLLHLVGAVVGGALAVALLRWKWVDCENWDLFSVMANRNTRSYIDRYQRREAGSAEPDLYVKQRNARRELRTAIAQKNWPHAATILLSMTMDERLECTSSEVIDAAGHCLYRQQRFDDAAQLYECLTQTSPAEHGLAKLKLAAIYVEVKQRPQAARRVLERVDRSALEPVLNKRWQEIADKADALVQSGVMELSCRV